MAEVREFNPAAMDAAAKTAMDQFGKFSKDDQSKFSCWFAAHYIDAGHKRLGRGLVKLAKGFVEAAGQKEKVKKPTKKTVTKE